MNSRKLIKVTFPAILIAGVFFLGPAPDAPEYNRTLPDLPSEPVALQEYIRLREGRHALKKDNEARIVWADSSRAKTPYSIVYLHGFSASQKEGDPVHLRLAKDF